MSSPSPHHPERPSDPAQARAAQALLMRQLTEQMEARQWGIADESALRLHYLLRTSSTLAPTTQSFLAELLARWGIVLSEQRRHEEASEQLQEAERLFNMELADATAWAAAHEIVVSGEGDSLDLALALRAMRLLAEYYQRFADPRAEALLRQVVSVAELVAHPPDLWEARQTLASYLLAQQEWQEVLVHAREMGILARREGNLAWLLPAMRFFAEAYTGLIRLHRAHEAQQLLVDIARFLSDPSLEREEAELAKMRAML